MIRNQFNCSRAVLLCFFLTTSLLITDKANAQRAGGNVGLGAQFGQPSGITLKIFPGGPFALDFLAAWDLDEFFFINVHGIFETPIGSSQANVFYGPGAFIGIRDRDRPFDKDDDEVILGISGSIGINYYIKQFELFLQLTPRLELIEETDGDIGGGLGFRFYF